jgi:hypothetical protein
VLRHVGLENNGSWVALFDAATGKELGRDHVDHVEDTPTTRPLDHGHVGVGHRRSLRHEWGTTGVIELDEERSQRAEELAQMSAYGGLRGIGRRPIPFSTGGTQHIEYDGTRARVRPLDGRGPEVVVDVGKGFLEFNEDDSKAAVVTVTGPCPSPDCVTARIFAWPPAAPLASVGLNDAPSFPFSTSPDGKLATLGSAVIDLVQGVVLWNAPMDAALVRFGADSQTLITADSAKRLNATVRDARSGASRQTLPERWPLESATRDSSWMLMANADLTLQALDTRTWKFSPSFTEPANGQPPPIFLEGLPFVVSFEYDRIDVVRLSDGAVMHVLFAYAKPPQGSPARSEEDVQVAPILTLAYRDDGTFDGSKAAWGLAGARVGSPRAGAMKALDEMASQLLRPGLEKAFFKGE